MLQILSKSPVLLVLVALVWGCAPSTTTARPRAADPEHVTSAEIAATPATNAYDLINRLRPRWLQPQRVGSIAGGTIRTQVIAVYLDGARLGGLEALRSISSHGITSMRFYDATRAATVMRDPGSDPIAGAIVITTTGAR